METKRISSLLVMVILFAVALHPGTASGSHPDRAHALTTSAITVSCSHPYAYSDFGAGSDAYLATKVTFSEFSGPLYFRMAVKDSTDGWATMSITNSTGGAITQAWVGHSWYVNSTDTKLHWAATFLDGGFDADGEQLMRIYMNATTTDAVAYNGTSLVLYTGENSGADHIWWQDLIAGTYLQAYYGTSYSAGNPYKSVRWGDGSWLMTVSKFYPTNPYSWEGGSTEIGWKMSIADSREPFKGSDEILIKFMTPNPNPVQAPPMLHLFPDDYTGGSTPPGDTIINVFDNESIYQQAAQYGFKRVLLHEQYFNWTGGHQWIASYWQPMNASVANAISHIQFYCHKYGLEFGLYFGWLFGTKWGALGAWNASSVAAAIESFNAFKAEWGDTHVVDFYYFDSSGPDHSSGTFPEFSGSVNVNLLDPIFKSLKANGTTIIYNAFQGDFWWADDRYLIPLKFEGSSLANMLAYYDKNIAGDTWTHTCNRATLYWSGEQMFDGFTDNYSWADANATIALAYKWGETADMPFHVRDMTSWMPSVAYVANWPSYAVRTGSVVGSSGESALLQNSTGISAYVQNHLAMTTVTMTICRDFENQTEERFGVFVGYNSMDQQSTTMKVLISMPSSSGIVCYDLTAESAVDINSTSSYFIFHAESGHVYYVYDSYSQSMHEALNGIISVVVIIFVLGLMVGMIAVVVGARRKN